MSCLLYCLIISTVSCLTEIVLCNASDSKCLDPLPCVPHADCLITHSVCVCELSLQTSHVFVPLCCCVAGCELKVTRSSDTSTLVLCIIFTHIKACGTVHRQGMHQPPCQYVPVCMYVCMYVRMCVCVCGMHKMCFSSSFRTI